MLAVWFLVIGLVLVLMSLAGGAVRRLPISTGLIYLLLGAALGPLGARLLLVDLATDVRWVEAIAEIAVLISLFAVGLKIEVAPSRRAWRVPLRLATLGMAVAIGLIALAGMALLALPLAAAVLLGAVLAPTDPVLASDVQMRDSGDRDRLRFALTAEGGINDGTAFAGVMLGLALIGVHEGGTWLWRWLAVDVLWATAAGLAVGWLCGNGVAQLATRLRQRGQALQFEEFLVLGVIALAYGVALLIKSYGFLAVFAAGLGVAAGERRAHAALQREGSAPVAPRLLTLAEQFERLAEVTVVLLVGSLLAAVLWRPQLLLFAAVLLLLVRPLSVLAAVPAGATSASQRRLLGWFGVRGIGSMYYLAFALHQGVAGGHARTLADATLVTVAASIIVHGISATPLMAWYQRRRAAAPPDAG